MDEPAPKPDPKLLDHDYDGIRELDNDPPLWFTLLFWATVAWGVLYGLHFAFGPGKTGIAAWQEQDIAIQELKAKSAGGTLTEEQLRGLSQNPQRIAAGAKLYGSANCATCHGPEGLGTVGPNLRDRFWMYGSTMTAIRTVIADGAGNGLMPAQKALLAPDDLTNLTIYLVSLSRAGLKDGRPIDPAREKDDPISY